MANKKKLDILAAETPAFGTQDAKIMQNILNEIAEKEAEKILEAPAPIPAPAPAPTPGSIEELEASLRSQGLPEAQIQLLLTFTRSYCASNAKIKRTEKTSWIYLGIRLGYNRAVAIRVTAKSRADVLAEIRKNAEAANAKSAKAISYKGIMYCCVKNGIISTEETDLHFFS